MRNVDCTGSIAGEVYKSDTITSVRCKRNQHGLGNGACEVCGDNIACVECKQNWHCVDNMSVKLATITLALSARKTTVKLDNMTFLSQK